MTKTHLPKQNLMACTSACFPINLLLWVYCRSKYFYLFNYSFVDQQHLQIPGRPVGLCKMFISLMMAIPRCK